jgi:hypothetical protein
MKVMMFEVLRGRGAMRGRVDHQDAVAVEEVLLLHDHGTVRECAGPVAAQPGHDFGRVPDANQEVDAEAREGAVRRTAGEVAGESPVSVAHPAKLRSRTGAVAGKSLRRCSM